MGAIFVNSLLISLTVHSLVISSGLYFRNHRPKDEGRLTLLPFSHIDPLDCFCYYLGLVGQAVKFDPTSLRYPGLVLPWALMGPLANLIIQL